MTREAPAPPGAGAPGDLQAEPEQGFIRELAQFFIVPSLIVLLCVGIFLMFGLATTEDASPREFLQRVRTGRGADRWQAAFELSRHIASEPDLGKDTALVEEIVAVLEEQGPEDARIRKYLAIALEKLGSPAGGPALLGLLRDTDADVRLHAVRAVASIPGLSGAIAPLSDLAADEDPAVRKMAVFALGQGRDRAAVAALLPRLDDPVEDVRWNAALALAVLGDRSGVSVIGTMLDRRHLDGIEGITEDQKIAALVNGVQAVYLLKEASLVERVRALSESDPSLKVREIALQALETLPRE